MRFRKHICYELGMSSLIFKDVADITDDFWSCTEAEGAQWHFRHGIRADFDFAIPPSAPPLIHNSNLFCLFYFLKTGYIFRKTLIHCIKP